MQVAKLLKLAKHLESGKLGHKVFDFNRFNAFGNKTRKNLCGTNGCALGECPFVFPKEWKFDPGLAFDPNLRANTTGNAISDAAVFFDIPEDASYKLFIPNQDLPWAPDAALTSAATRKQVARNIRQYINWSLLQAGFYDVTV